MVSLLATTCALHAPLALWFDRRGSPSAAPRADEGFDQVLQLSAHAAPTGPCLRVTPESRLEEEGRVLGAALHVRNAQEQSAALALVGSVEWILVEAGAPQPCIVAENLLAATEGSPTRVAVCVDSAAGVPGLAFALQRGVDALVCPAEAATGALLEALKVAKAQRLEVADPPAPAAAAATAEPTAVELRQARVLGVYEGGVADRVALDFTTLLGDDEGVPLASTHSPLPTSTPTLTRSLPARCRTCILHTSTHHYSPLLTTTHYYALLLTTTHYYTCPLPHHPVRLLPATDDTPHLLT